MYDPLVQSILSDFSYFHFEPFHIAGTHLQPHNQLWPHHQHQPQIGLHKIQGSDSTCSAICPAWGINALSLHVSYSKTCSKTVVPESRDWSFQHGWLACINVGWCTWVGQGVGLWESHSVGNWSRDIDTPAVEKRSCGEQAKGDIWELMGHWKAGIVNGMVVSQASWRKLTIDFTLIQTSQTW